MKKMNESAIKGRTPTAIQLPSGNWRCRVSYTDSDGVKHSAPFTEPTKELAEAKAIMWKAGLIEQEKTRKSVTVGQAIDAYIETGRCTGMKCTTISGHVSARKNAFKSIEKRRVQNLSLRDIQTWINARAKDHAPKTVKNNYNLLVAALKQHEVDLNWNALRLPKCKIVEPEMPSDDQVSAMLDTLRDRGDDDMFIAVMLASLYGLRRSEICALTWSDIQTTEDGKHLLVINKALVIDEYNMCVLADTKTEAGERTISIAESVYAELMKRRTLRPYIISIRPNVVTTRYAKLANQFDVCTRFHVLRHYMASVMAREDVHPKYASKLLGHASPSTTQRIYTHVMPEKVVQIDSRLEEHATSVLGS